MIFDNDTGDDRTWQLVGRIAFGVTIALCLALVVCLWGAR